MEGLRGVRGTAVPAGVRFFFCGVQDTWMDQALGPGYPLLELEQQGNRYRAGGSIIPYHILVGWDVMTSERRQALKTSLHR